MQQEHLLEQIHATHFLQMMKKGAQVLQKNIEVVNALNVYPVPDGDTGINMSMTLSSGVKEMEKYADGYVGQMAEALSKGLLMGARGNSGVILSQLFRGFAKALAGKQTMNARQLADAFYQGVETAYQAVIKPVEGTVLTVAREAADAGMKSAWTANDPAEIMKIIYQNAKETLAKTPQMLSVLEETNVVDAGGQGLVFIYEGMLSSLSGEEITSTPTTTTRDLPDLDALTKQAHEQYAGAHIHPEQIKHGYCTEFMIQLKTTRRPVGTFNEQQFRQQLAQYGDSLLVVADDELVKVHIHAETPGDVLNHAMKFGDLNNIKIDNMREQHKQVTEEASNPPSSIPAKDTAHKRYAVLVIAAGEGNTEVFRSLGADLVIEGGQTMNPSTEEIVEAVQRLNASHVFILPNNKNIILAAKQAKQLVDLPITVIETKTIPQGMAALFAFDMEKSATENEQIMTDHFQAIRTGEVTYAIRDTQINDLSIAKGDYLGLADGEITVSGKELFTVADKLIASLLTDDSEVITLIYGQEISRDEAERWKTKLEQQYPDHEFEVHEGGQPLYYFLIGVE